MVENSWGADAGYKGHLIMTDRWFDEYMFRLVVETRYVPEKLRKLFEQEPVRLPAWDPMFAPNSRDRHGSSLYPKSVIRVQSDFVLPPCRLAVAFVEGVAGYAGTKRQTRCR